MTTFYNYVKKLGFGEKTGIDIPGEIKGSVKPLKNWSNTSSYMMPIGQEVGVNLVQLMMPYLAIANGGFMVNPHIVKKIDLQGTIKETPIEKKRIFSAATSERAKNILFGVVDSGTGMLARIAGVKIGGKTGTAQKYDPVLHHYSPSSYRSSFVGFISSIDRPVVIAVSISDPKRAHYGGVVAAPIFRKIAEKVINYWGRDKFLGHNTNIQNLPALPHYTPVRSQ
jgi:cell division protein FtsI/penicillin-binding protein 2